VCSSVLGQNIFIIPSEDLVIVKVAQQMDAHLDLVHTLSMILVS
jgi:hypothetical protein